MVAGNASSIDIVDYLENSLSGSSNRSLTEMVFLSVGMSLYTLIGVLG